MSPGCLLGFLSKRNLAVLGAGIVLAGCSIDSALTPPSDVGTVGSISPVALPAGAGKGHGVRTPTAQPYPADFTQETKRPIEAVEAVSAPLPADQPSVADAPQSAADFQPVAASTNDAAVVAAPPPTVDQAQPTTWRSDEGASPARASDISAPSPAPQTQVALNMRPDNPAKSSGGMPAAGPMSPRAPTMPDNEIACRNALHQLGVQFVDIPRISNGPACGIDYPIKLTGLSGGIRIKPAATLNCQVTLEFAKWVKRDVAPAARSRYLSGISSITQLSSYSCRTMNSEKGAPMSEHAHGNAIDVGSITLDSGRKIDVRQPGWFAFRQRGFLNTVRGDSCGYFNTVLGPGTNKYHWNHFHFDLRERKSGRTYCE